MEGQKAHIVFTYPPYNIRFDGHVGGLGHIHHREFAMASGQMSTAQFTPFLGTAMDHLIAQSVDGSLQNLYIDWRHLQAMMTAGFPRYTDFKDLCVWVRGNAGMGSLFRNQHELVQLLKCGQVPHQNRLSDLQMTTCSTFGHSLCF